MRKNVIVDADIGRSHELAWILAAGHACAATAPWLAGLPGWAALTIGALVVVQGVRQVRRFAGPLGGADVLGLQLEAQGQLVLHRSDREAAVAECLAIETLGPWGILLRYREAPKRTARLLVWRDQCDPRAFRRLRIAARWGAGRAPVAGSMADVGWDVR